MNRRGSENVGVADTSAWARAHHVADEWTEAMAGGRIGMSDLVALELLYSTRDGAEFDERAGELALLPQAPVTPTVLSNARAAFRVLANHHPLFHRSVTLADLITAAEADAGMGVLHDDADFDILAGVLPFESRGSRPVDRSTRLSRDVKSSSAARTPAAPWRRSALRAPSRAEPR